MYRCGRRGESNLSVRGLAVWTKAAASAAFVGLALAMLFPSCRRPEPLPLSFDPQDPTRQFCEFLQVNFSAEGAQDRLSPQDALEDISQFEYILRYGYAGFDRCVAEGFDFDGYFDSLERKVASKTVDILPDELFLLIKEDFPPIRDGHLSFILGQDRFRSFYHDDYYCSGLFLEETEGEYRVLEPGSSGLAKGARFTGESNSLFKTLDGEGDVRWTVGTLSAQSLSSLKTSFDGESCELPVSQPPMEVPAWADTWSFEFSSDKKTCFITLNTCDDVYSWNPDGVRAALQEFSAFGKKLRGCRHVVIDVRGNGGGNGTYFWIFLDNLVGVKSLSDTGTRLKDVFSPVTIQLQDWTIQRMDPKIFDSHWQQWELTLDRAKREIQEMRARPAKYMVETADEGALLSLFHERTSFKGDIIILADRETASTGEDIMGTPAQHGLGFSLGENSRGFNISAMVQDYYLPHSGIRLSVPMRVCVNSSSQGEGRGVFPDYWLSGNALPKLKKYLEKLDASEKE